MDPQTKSKYFTIVIRADDETAARSLVPGELVRGNPITGCSLGDALRLNEKLKELIPAEKEDEVCAAEQADLEAFFPTTPQAPVSSDPSKG